MFASRLRLIAIIAIAAGVVSVLAGCASAPSSGSSTTNPGPGHPRYAIALEPATDRRDFSRLQVAPELERIFDPTYDVYVLDPGNNPYNVEFNSGSVFRWDRPPADVVRDAVRAELERNDWVRWVRLLPVPVSEPPNFVVRLNVTEYHYLRTEQAFFPKVSVEALIIDPANGNVVDKIPARVKDEFYVQAGRVNKNLYTFVVEDWMEPDLREQMRRALELVSEKVSNRLSELLAAIAAGQKPRSEPSP